RGTWSSYRPRRPATTATRTSRSGAIAFGLSPPSASGRTAVPAPRATRRARSAFAGPAAPEEDEPDGDGDHHGHGQNQAEDRSGQEAGRERGDDRGHEPPSARLPAAKALPGLRRA